MAGIIRDVNARAQALHDAADQLEHGVEYNDVDLTPAERRENNRLIGQVRELRARADAAERGES